MILNIVKYNSDPSGILRKPTIDVKNNEHTKQLISDMIETLKSTSGVGLAAPQVGKNLNLFIVSFGPTFDQIYTEVFINPKIYSFGYNTQMPEGCLSVPNVDLLITRKSKVKVEYYDRNWKSQLKEFDGLLSRVIQHEYDHLVGKLITDY